MSKDPIRDFWRDQLETTFARPTPPGVVSLGRQQPSGEPVLLDPEERTHHVYVVGKTGMGKTTLLRNLISQDLAAGHGLAVLSPDDELFRDYLLPAIPRRRIDDVIYVNPADTDSPVPLNPLHVGPGERLHEKVDETRRVFLRLVEGHADAAGAHRMERILHAALHTLIEIPGHTVLDIRRLLSRTKLGDQFRESIVDQITDEEVRNIWLEDYPVFPKDAHQAVLNRMARLLTPPVRALLCTPGACLDFRQAIDSKKILLFRLTAKACQGAGNAQIVGQLVIAKLNLAAMSRDDTPQPERQFFPVFIDEFQKFCGLSLGDYEEMFSRSRKFRVPLTIAHLQTGQLPDSLMRHILGTVSTLVVFRVGAADARRLSREMILPPSRDAKLRALDPSHLVSLSKYRAYCKVRDRVLNVRMPASPPREDAATREEVVQRSRHLYGAGPPSPRAAKHSPTREQSTFADIDPKDPFA